MNNSSVGQRIKSLRIERGLNQQALGDILGIGQRAISMIEHGANQPTIKQIELLSNYFSVTTDYLIKGFYANNTDIEAINTVKKLLSIIN